VIAGALLAAAAVAGSLLLARKRPGIAFGLMWFVVIGLPTSQIIPLPPVLRADRYLYFSGIGLLIALAAVAGELARQPRARHVAVALLLGTASLLAVSSARRQGVWTDSRTLWTDSVAKAPANDLSRRALGRVLLAGGDVEGALAQYRRALELDPELMVNLQDLGSALVLAGRMEEAIPLFEKSVARFPRSIKGWSSLGHCRLQGRGDAEGALACFVKVAELDPTDPEPLDQAAMCFTRLGRRDIARAWRERAEQLRQARAAPAR
jgi:tetratricopeptide (TPR) repeat protein